MRLYKKIFVFLLGLILTLSIFEVILRLVYTPESETRTKILSSESSHPNFTILFLGNSHTFGAGVNPKDAYPDVIQRFFNKGLKGTNYTVRIINAGKNTANTSEIYKALDYQLGEYRPNMVHIMGGEPNYWNKNGMGEFLTEKYGYGLSFWSQSLLYLSNYSKVVRWFASITHLSKNVQLSDQTEEEIAIFKIITDTEDHYIKFIEKNSHHKQIFEKLDHFISVNKQNPPRNIWRVLLYVHSRYQFFLNENIDSVVKQINDSISFDKTQFDVFSYLLIKEMLAVPNISANYKLELQKILNSLLKENAKPGLQISDKCARYTLTSNDHAILPDEKESVLKECQKLFPAFALPAEGLYTYYLERNRPNEAFSAIIQTLTVNPFASRNEIKKHLLQVLTNRYAKAEIKFAAEKLINDFSEKYPSEAYLYRPDNGEKIPEWIEFDLKKIADKSKDSGATIVFQNYHWLRNKAEGFEVNQVIERSALKFRVPFIDISTQFKSTVQNSGDIESYFTQVFGQNDSHPSEKGHRLIAYLLYSEMVRQKILPDELSHFNAKDILDGNY